MWPVSSLPSLCMRKGLDDNVCANICPPSWIRTKDPRGILHIDCSFGPKQCGRAWIRTRDRRGISSVL